jgi:hypothetical protein
LAGTHMLSHLNLLEQGCDELSTNDCCLASCFVKFEDLAS